jgi:hypothetical protein
VKKPLAPIQRKWFRVEQDASGAILSCEEVSTRGSKGAHVRYYEAVDKEDACAQAKAWLTSYHLRICRKEAASSKRILREAEAEERAGVDPKDRGWSIAGAQARSIKDDARVRLLETGMCFECGSAPFVDGARCKACLQTYVASAQVRARPRTAAQLRGDGARRAKLIEIGKQKTRARKDLESALGLNETSRRWLTEIKLFDRLGPERYREDLVRRFTDAGGDVDLVAAHKRAAKARRAS